ncbi:MAG: Ni/Fe hydrogenase subunit alpha [Deltaproteobacteria bacterium]|nr:Ni/Fe hydrogenase subunit alpha [Deltaproteobacteria bacterium]MBZ0220592.1 Ni/Fe hydrogenase subunit alpha [Deltaproteobacteria bacterium]
MKRDLNIKVHEITRVEGHGNIVIDVKKGVIKELKLEIIESPRFFEMMLRGRRYDEAQHIMARICGICAVSHTSASLRAIEDAMDIRISSQASLLRKLAFDGEMLQSHILHIFFLVLPDLAGVGSIVPLLASHPEMAKTGLELKRLANEICETVGGRHIHPISLFPGGVVFTPKPADLKKLKRELEASFSGLEAALEFLANAKLPDFSLEREFISLKSKGEYAFYSGEPVSSLGNEIDPKCFTDEVKEYVVEHSSAKHARSSKGTYMVGALARINNNRRQLGPRAKDALKASGMKLPCHNPFMNNMAQLIECFHATEEAIGFIDELLELGPKPEPLAKPEGYGRGVGIVEAPRGTLYHEYEINRDGLIESSVCIIPTAQNLRSIEDDLRAFVPTVLDRPKAEITKGVETLVRAYDPCISCSAHIMDVSFLD